MGHIFTIFRRQPTSSVLQIAPGYEYTIHYYQKSLGILRISQKGLWWLDLKCMGASYGHSNFNQHFIGSTNKSKIVKTMTLDFILTNFNQIIK